MRLLALLLLLLVAIAETAYVFWPVAAQPPAAPTPAYQKAKADALFDSAFKQFSSQPVALAQYRGRPLVVYFWATWCADCQAEAKALMALQQRHPGDGLTVIAIGIDQSDKLERYQREHGLAYPVFVAGTDGILLSKKLGNLLGELPFVAAIDRRGVFVARHLGKFTPDTPEAMAAAALR